MILWNHAHTVWSTCAKKPTFHASVCKSSYENGVYVFSYFNILRPYRGTKHSTKNMNNTIRITLLK